MQFKPWEETAENGLSFDSLQDVIDKITMEYQVPFGDSIRNTPQSDMGNMIMVNAESYYILVELFQFLINQINPNTATKVFLNHLVGLNGLARKEKSYTTCTVDYKAYDTNTEDAVVEIGTLIKDPNSDIQVRTTASLIVSPGDTETVSVEATKTGPIEIAVNTLTEEINPTYGIESVTNNVEGTVGAHQEKCPALRRRRYIKAKSGSSCDVYAIQSAIDAVNNVEYVRIFNNNTSETVNGIPPHHMYIIVKGGSDTDIANAILYSSSAGDSFYGSTTVTIPDAPGGSQSFSFGRLITQTVYINSRITIDPNEFPKDGRDQIKDMLLQLFAGTLEIEGRTVEQPKPGGKINYGHLYTPFTYVPGCTVEELYVGLSANPTGMSNIQLALEDEPNLEKVNIQIV